MNFKEIAFGILFSLFLLLVRLRSSACVGRFKVLCELFTCGHRAVGKMATKRKNIYFSVSKDLFFSIFRSLSLQRSMTKKQNKCGDQPSERRGGKETFDLFAFSFLLQELQCLFSSCSRCTSQMMCLCSALHHDIVFFSF